MTRSLPVVVLLGALAACGGADSLPVPAPMGHSRLIQSLRDTCPERDAPDYLFPDAVLPWAYKQPRAIVDWRAEPLQALGVPSLSCGATPREAYRLLWLHPFGRAIVVDLVEAPAGWRMHAGIVVQPEREPWEVAKQRARELLPEEVEAVRRAMDADGVWGLRHETGQMPDDGVCWIIEARRDGGYLYVERRADTRPIVRVAKVLLSLGGYPTSEADEETWYRRAEAAAARWRAGQR